MTEAQVFKALGDPVRLEIVKRLSDGAIHTMGSLTKNLDISRQGARKQVQVLVSANIVHLKPNGREVQVLLDINSLKLGKKFITHLEREWDTRLSKLKEILETTHKKRTHKHRVRSQSGFLAK
ncbi:ArsR family transcriptional regulator [Candidatus Parcubacteria bacterium]|nr:MAG: ArsR family transcriptional regulator [Candidatus Parcubacteria bacterium]